MARDAVAEIRERIDIVDLVSAQVNLRKTGRTFKGLCPFHQEKTPSFIVFPDSGTFHCFGCGKGGDIFTYYMEIERAEFREALAELAKRAGVELASAPPPSPERDEHRHRLIELNELAATFYASQLKSAAAGEPGRKLVEQRGLNESVVTAFQLGYAPDGWDTLLKFLSAKGVDLALAVEAGILTERENGSTYDRFRARLLFPIRDRDGAALGFGGRAMGDAQPKYLNSPQSAIFDKSTILYGLDLAKDEIRARDQVVLVEGYMDAITAHQYGHRNVVATMGTAVTEHQLAQIKRLTSNVVLALDADSAGQMATLRTIESISDAADDAVPVPDAAGVVRFERRMKANIAIVELPRGKDPDELIRADASAWPEVVKSAKPFLDFFVHRVAADVDMNDPKAKSAAVARIAPLLRLIPDRLVQAHYVDLAAALLKISDRRLIMGQVRSAATPGGLRASGPGRAPVTPRAHPEQHLVALLLKHHALLGAVLAQIQPGELEDARSRELVRIVTASGGAFRSAEDLITSLDETLGPYAQSLVDALAMRPPLVPVELAKEAQRALDAVRREQHERLIRQLQFEIELAQREGDSASVETLLPRFNELATLHRSLYPPKSPYFRDARDKDLSSARPYQGH